MKYKYSDKNGYKSKLRHDEYDDIYSSEDKKPKKSYVDIYSSERKKDKFVNKVNWTKVFTFTFFLMLGIIGCLMLYAYKTLHSFNYDGNPVVLEEQDDLVSDSMVLNVLLIGSDSMSVGDGGRSDSMILLSLDARHKKIKLTSLMRDLWVTIPGHGQDRLNASYAFGGPQLTIETIAKNFGILVDRYAVVDFEGFLKIIDILGGVDLELTADECAYINKYSQDKNTLRGSGVKHLTGLQALHYSRDRNSIGSDYDRTSRQRNLLKALVTQMKSANLAQITEVLAQIGPLVTTNFKTNEVSRMATHAMTYLKYPVEEFRLPTDDNVRNETYSGKMVLVINNTAKAKQDIYNFIYEPDPDSQPKIKAETYSTKSAESAPQSKSSSSKSESATPKTNARRTDQTTKQNTTKQSTAQAETKSTAKTEIASTQAQTQSQNATVQSTKTTTVTTAPAA
ncbi:MAG: LCP family protein [Clostridia bacterium]|nr:LCP family protein [Clostridia bacterium]